MNNKVITVANVSFSSLYSLKEFEDSCLFKRIYHELGPDHKIGAVLQGEDIMHVYIYGQRVFDKHIHNVDLATHMSIAKMIQDAIELDDEALARVAQHLINCRGKTLFTHAPELDDPKLPLVFSGERHYRSLKISRIYNVSANAQLQIGRPHDGECSAIISYKGIVQNTSGLPLLPPITLPMLVSRELSWPMGALQLYMDKKKMMANRDIDNRKIAKLIRETFDDDINAHFDEIANTKNYVHMFPHCHRWAIHNV